MDLEKALINAASTVGKKQAEGAQASLEAEARLEAHEEFMKQRCETVKTIMNPLLSKEVFLRMANDKSDERIRNALAGYLKKQAPYHPGSIKSTTVRNYFPMATRNDWKPLLETGGSFVLFRNTEPTNPNSDFEVKILLGLSCIVAGDYVGVNFIERAEKTQPAIEIDIKVKAGNEASYEICSSSHHESKPLSDQELASELYTRIIEGLDIDASRAAIYLTNTEAGVSTSALPPANTR